MYYRCALCRCIVKWWKQHFGKQEERMDNFISLPSSTVTHLQQRHTCYCFTAQPQHQHLYQGCCIFEFEFEGLTFFKIWILNKDWFVCMHNNYKYESLNNFWSSRIHPLSSNWDPNVPGSKFYLLYSDRVRPICMAAGLRSVCQYV